jgi:hypothetical protein
MLMPETPIDENDFSPVTENNIWATGQVPGI